ncbi:MAG TPA: HPP family protein [Ktedonobacterales bacterium]
MVSDEVSERARAKGSPEDGEARRRRFCVSWALVTLPLFLGVVAITASATHLRFLLFPPLAAIGFALFLDPYHPRATLRSVVAGPVAGALIGVAVLAWLPAGPWRVVAVTALGIVALYVLRAELTPALAVALLTLLVGASGVAYIVSIALSSLVLWALFLVWRRLVYSRVYPPAGHCDTPHLAPRKREP